MKTAAYNAFVAARATAAAAAPKKAPLVSRKINVFTDKPEEKTTKNGRPYTVLTGYEAETNELFRILLFGKAAREALDTLTKDDFVQFTGRQELIPERYNTIKSKRSILVDYSDSGAIKMLKPSQEKAKSKSGMQAKADAGIEAFAEADLPF